MYFTTYLPNYRGMYRYSICRNFQVNNRRWLPLQALSLLRVACLVLFRLRTTGEPAGLSRPCGKLHRRASSHPTSPSAPPAPPRRRRRRLSPIQSIGLLIRPPGPSLFEIMSLSALFSFFPLLVYFPPSFFHPPPQSHVRVGLSLTTHKSVIPNNPLYFPTVGGYQGDVSILVRFT
ncbi:hypothetical protein LZ30DRAFT_21729 [Colletotrichum cereale]|nr:hypothetical protein LZ30DRAFT_21729 [Colletotrichum cereale]